MGHRLTNETIIAGLNAQLDAESLEEPWVCFVQTNGDVQVLGIPGRVEPPLDKRMWLMQVLRALNKEVWLDGAWIGAWGDWGVRHDARDTGLAIREPQRVVIMFKDRDGDVPFTIDSELRWSELLHNGEDSFCNQAIQAHRAYHDWLKEADIKPENMINQAMGEAPTGMAAPDL